MSRQSKNKPQPSIDRLIEFQDLLIKFKSIDRVIHFRIKNQYVPENDMEHSYSLAMFGWYLSSFFPQLDRDKVIRIALVHDLVEIHAGDTYAYTTDKNLRDSKHEREKIAAEKLAADWPDFSDMNELISSYEARSDAESRFVYVLDKLLPTFINVLADGYSWKKMKISLDMHKENKGEKIKMYEELLPLYNKLNDFLEEHSDMLYQPKSN